MLSDVFPIGNASNVHVHSALPAGMSSAAERPGHETSLREAARNGISRHDHPLREIVQSIWITAIDRIAAAVAEELADGGRKRSAAAALVVVNFQKTDVRPRLFHVLCRAQACFFRLPDKLKTARPGSIWCGLPSDAHRYLTSAVISFSSLQATRPLDTTPSSFSIPSVPSYLRCLSNISPIAVLELAKARSIGVMSCASLRCTSAP